MLRPHIALCLGIAATLWRAPATAYADEVIFLSGDRVPGLVLEEGRRGIWVEITPYIALFYDYERLVRVEKWSAERNVALFKRPPRLPPLPATAVNNPVVMVSATHVWVLVKPDTALMVDRGQFDKRRAASANAPGGVSADGASLVATRQAALRRLYEKPEALTPAQLTHRLGPPTKRLRQDGVPRWVYQLPDGTRAILHFREGMLDYVDWVPAEQPTP